MTNDRHTPYPLKSPSRNRIRSIVGAFSVALLLVLSVSSVYAAHYTSPLVSLSNSVTPRVSSSHMLGHHNSSDQLTVGLLLPLNNQAGMQSLIASLYNPHSSLYHHWLQTGEFNARFGPSSSQLATARHFLTSTGLHLVSSPSSTLVLATGTTNQIEAAFHTTINDYSSSDGKVFYANSTSAQIPAILSGSVIGVLGLNNAANEQTHIQLSAKSASQSPNLPPPYGGGPFGRGLTPSQFQGIYDATPVYKQLHDRGQGITLAVFELSGYTQSDIGVYENKFNLRHVPLQNRLVLGGPIPVGGALDYAAGEVELDIELQIAMAPGAKGLLVYNAPNTELGVVAEYLQMAMDNQADSMSTSWGLCEYLTTSSGRLGEFQAMSQMATQGQSLFDASGDNGAFDCLGSVSLSGSDALQADDPGSQPYITAVGATSFQGPDGVTTFDPGSNMHPSYPGTSAELTWIDTPCDATQCPGGGSGGGVSRFWGSPDYQFFDGFAPPGVIEPGFSQMGAYCGQTAGVLCREEPDVSMDGDPSTGYAIYCTDPQDAGCGSSTFDIHGWIRFGGTSTDAPLWAGITALIDHQTGGRQGLLNYFLYSFDSSAGYSSQFHDITLDNNGFYPAGPNYDMSTGIGSPDIFHLVKP
jgi:subtilase family serine protease